MSARVCLAHIARSSGVRPRLPVSTDHPELIESGRWLVWYVDAMTVPPGTSPVAWTVRHRDHLRGLGIDPEELLDEVRVRGTEPRHLAYELTDRVLDRLGFSGISPGPLSVDSSGTST